MSKIQTQRPLTKLANFFPGRDGIPNVAFVTFDVKVVWRICPRKKWLEQNQVRASDGGSINDIRT